VTLQMARTELDRYIQEVRDNPAIYDAVKWRGLEDQLEQAVRHLEDSPPF